MRYIAGDVVRDLRRKMVFIGGPRQSGKTTLARYLVGDPRPTEPLEGGPAIFPGGAYFSWDAEDDRRALLGRRWRDADRLLALDELHKYPGWKRWIKGLWDTTAGKHRFVVTGSARLDVYRRGGDSLQGRYHYWRLHPFGLDEIPRGIAPEEALRRFLTVGPFPEPFLGNDEREARRWRRERFARVLRDDLRDMEAIREMAKLELFVDALRQRVGSPVVLSHIAGDLQVSPVTLRKWLESLERMYLCFAVYPWTRSLPRAIQKPPKVYFFDSGDVVGDDGARFENFVAASLLRRLHFWEDRDGYRCRLWYVRDKEGHEADFLLEREGKIVELVEAKVGDPEVGRGLRYFAQRLRPAKASRIVRDLKRPWSDHGIEVTDALAAFATLEPGRT
ncbi:MAG: ATP-binding protein [Deltaproteobacteria bacterium]|nr:ATP-binding protein [Deltaproteobacteria bacterium]